MDAAERFGISDPMRFLNLVPNSQKPTPVPGLSLETALVSATNNYMQMVMSLPLSVSTGQTEQTVMKLDALQQDLTTLRQLLTTPGAFKPEVDVAGPVRSPEQAWLDAKEKKGTDLMITVTDGSGNTHEYPFHSEYLAASPKLHSKMIEGIDIYADESTPSTLSIVMDTKDPVVIEQFLKFFYTKEIDHAASLEAVKELLLLSVKHDVSSLEEACLTRLDLKLTSDTISDFKRFAEEHQLSKLTKLCADYDDVVDLYD